MPAPAVLVAFLLISSDAMAYNYTYNPNTGRLDAVGVNASADISIVCDAGLVLKSDGGGSFSCQADAGGAGAGDIDAVGDVASGAAFNGTQGTTLTFNSATGDQTFAISDEEGRIFKSSAGIKTSGDLFVVGGDINLGNTNIFSGGDTASLNNLDAIDSTTETTLESAIDIAGDVTGTGLGSVAVGDDSHAHTTTTVSGLVDADMSNDALDPDKLVGDGTDDDKVDSSIVEQNAGTDISADLEEEVTEGSLADSTIVSADIKDGTIAAGDLASDSVTEAKLKAVDAAVDEDIVTYESTTGDFEYHTCAEITGSADLCDGNDATGAGGGDEVSIDSVAVTNPDFVSTGQVDFVDTSNTVTANINDNSILEADLKAVDTASDEDILTYESTTGDFEWHTPAELSLQPLESTLTDIADGTIAEDLVNTANPWADNEVADDITAGNVEGTDLGTLTNAKYCTYDSANTEIDCASDGGSGSKPNKDYFWPASATLPLEAADSIPPISKIAGTNIDELSVDFDSSTDECRTVTFNIPSDVTAGGSVPIYVDWKMNTTNTGNVVWDFRHNSGTASGASTDVALTTVASAASAVDAVMGKITRTNWSTDTTTAGWVASDDVVAVFCRDANNGSDSATQDAQMIGAGISIPRT